MFLLFIFFQVVELYSLYNLKRFHYNLFDVRFDPYKLYCIRAVTIYHVILEG